MQRSVTENVVSGQKENAQGLGMFPAPSTGLGIAIRFDKADMEKSMRSFPKNTI